MRIIDDDTQKMLQENGIQARDRQNGIDAPEKAQPFGQRSRQALSDLPVGKVVRSQVITGIVTLGKVWCGSMDINAKLTPDASQCRALGIYPVRDNDQYTMYIDLQCFYDPE